MHDIIIMITIVSFYMAECCIPDFHGDHYDDIDHSIWYFEVGGL